MKKNLTRLFTVLLAIGIIAGFAGCSNNSASKSKYVGTWVATKGEMSGMSLDVAAMGLKMEMALKEDGTVELVSSESDDNSTGKWEETEKGIKLKDGKGEDMEFVAEGEKLTTEVEGVKIIFEKKQ